RKFLAERLPEYMVPSAFVALEDLPRTPNGKVDRSALPKPTRSAFASRAPAARPRTVVEETVLGIWSEVLGVGRVGIEDNFFELGGHSLLLVKVHARLREEFGEGTVTLTDLLAYSTVERLAAYLSGELTSRRRAKRRRKTVGAGDERIAVIGMSC